MTSNEFTSGNEGLPTVVARHRDAIIELCRCHQVSRLEIFGSVVSGGFEPGRSDIDFLVEFQSDADLGPWLREYFDLKDSLERLLGCRVDLVQSRAPSSPLFWQEAAKSRRVLYAA